MYRAIIMKKNAEAFIMLLTNIIETHNLITPGMLWISKFKVQYRVEFSFCTKFINHKNNLAFCAFCPSNELRLEAR